MGYHNALAGADLHEPSRLRILNSTSAILVPGNVVTLLEAPTVFGVTTITELAPEDSGIVGFVDSVIGRGDEGTVVFIGKVTNVEIESSSDLKANDYLKVGSAGNLVKTISVTERVATVLFRDSTISTRIDIFMDSTSATTFAVEKAGAMHLHNGYVNPTEFTGLTFSDTTAPGTPITRNTVSTNSRIGFTDFGGGLTNTSGNASFSLIESTNQPPAVSGVGTTYDTVQINRTGIYEIKMDPFFYMLGDGTAPGDLIQIEQTTTNNVVTPIDVYYRIDLIRTPSGGTGSAIFTNTTHDGRINTRDVAPPEVISRRGALSWFAHDFYGYPQNESHLQTADTLPVDVEAPAVNFVTQNGQNLTGIEQLIGGSDVPIMQQLNDGDTLHVEFSVILFRNDGFAADGTTPIYSFFTTMRVDLPELFGSSIVSTQAVAGFTLKQVDFEQVAD